MVPRLYIVIPCYNEQEVLPITAPMFLEKVKSLAEKGKISEDSRVLFVNDGSKDNTWNIIKELAAQDEHYIGICQSRNRGHQAAVLAGLMEAKDVCDITISIDCDGQDDINAMDEMVEGLCTKAEENTGASGIFTNTVEYNSLNLPTRLAHTDNDGYSSETIFEYDEQGRCIKVDTDYDVTEFTYDSENLPRSATRTRDGGKPCAITYTYQLFYLDEVPQIPFHINEYLSGLEV